MAVDDDNVVKFKNGSTLLEGIEAITKLANSGHIIGLVGYAVFTDGHIVSINTDHALVDNGMIAYCSVLLARQVGDNSEED